MKKLKHITQDEAAAMFPDPITVNRYSGLRGIDAVVIFENQISDSPEHGKRTAVPVGQGTSHSTVGEMRGAWLSSGPTRQEAVAFCIITNI